MLKGVDKFTLLEQCTRMIPYTSLHYLFRHTEYRSEFLLCNTPSPIAGIYSYFFPTLTDRSSAPNATPTEGATTAWVSPSSLCASATCRVGPVRSESRTCCHDQPDSANRSATRCQLRCPFMVENIPEMGTEIESKVCDSRSSETAESEPIRKSSWTGGIELLERHNPL